MEETTIPEQPKRARKLGRIAIYIFAAVGLLFSVLIAVIALQEKPQAPRTFDANEAIDGVMTRNYGKYSEAQHGWLYVDEASHATYLVTVVQQKKVDGKEGDELYLVTSGQATDGDDSFYGVFQLRYRDGQLYEYSDPRRASGVEPVTPERVHFEALSADVWGWVVKVKMKEFGVGQQFTTTNNVVLAPRNEQIVELTEFTSAFQVLGGGDCKETESRYAEWEKTKGDKKIAPAEGEGSPETPSEEVEDDEDIVPPRCTQLQWSYRTDPVSDSTFTPLYITRKAGMQEGIQVDTKTWKVMFDPKSYTYLLPDELKNVGT
ncbi:hypothetical protein SAMN05518865_101373 [Duganella sp. CF458]|uniref:hypothetical protein n=1 Tax=Duganella sp. CF458 TaxID=1884368 RepID=UPI0008E6E06A|nr:hypothetical protein [Duganella sp. CF458]SFF54440.1 hypothetical protein SAMN05518865_101373 [Duganella sp. CF458]